MAETRIEWTDAVWNPVTGCTKVSSGCKHCYAEGMAKRFWGGEREFTDVRCHPERLEQPLRWRKSRRVFVNSMSDLFHDDVPFGFVDKVMSVMALTPQHRFQVLTKRPAIMREYFERLNSPTASLEGEANAEWLLGFLGWDRWNASITAVSDYFRTTGASRPNLMLGVSVEDQKTADERIPILLQTPAALRFVSVEPMLGPVDLRHLDPWDDFHTDALDTSDTSCKIGWVICGGESGPGARPMHPDWARSLRDQCVDAGVPFFFKQWGEWAPDCWCGEPGHADKTTPRPKPGTFGVMFRCGKKAAGRELDGRTWGQFPERGIR